MRKRVTRRWLISLSVVLLHEENGWRLSSGLAPSREFEEHVGALLDKIRPHWARFLQVSRSYYVELSCTVRMYDDGYFGCPAVGFTPSQIKDLSAFNSNIDIDLYVFDAESYADCIGSEG